MLERNEKQLNNRTIRKSNRILKQQLDVLTIELLELVGNTLQDLNLQNHTQNHLRYDVEYHKDIVSASS